MKNNLSKIELVNYLKNLKSLLDTFDYNRISNVIFYNFDSYITYVNNQCTKNNNQKYTVEVLLNSLEPYIPFEFDDDSLDFLISKVIDDYDPISFQNILIKRAKIDFINSVKNATTEDKWSKIIDKCENIYQYKETNGISYI